MNAESAERVIHAVVHGRVQGVGYRAWTERQAQAHGLSGWVRNRSDGTVEAVLAGKADVVAAMAEILTRGPPKSSVTNVEITDADAGALKAGARFTVLPTL